jgi:hypothetical protein
MVAVCYMTAGFYNWNKVKVRYCDGASFSGNVENEVKVSFPIYVYSLPT